MWVMNPPSALESRRSLRGKWQDLTPPHLCQGGLPLGPAPVCHPAKKQLREVVQLLGPGTPVTALRERWSRIPGTRAEALGPVRLPDQSPELEVGARAIPKRRATVVAPSHPAWLPLSRRLGPGGRDPRRLRPVTHPGRSPL